MNSTRPFEPANQRIFGSHFLSRWEQPRQWFVPDRFQFVPKFNYGFKVTQSDATEVAVSAGWVVVTEFTTSTTPDSVGTPQEVAGNTVGSLVDGDTIYLEVTYAVAQFSTAPGSAPHSLDVGGTPVSGFLIEDYYGSAAASCAFVAGNALTGSSTKLLWPLASIAIDSGVMTITPIFTGGVVRIPHIINIPIP